MQLTAVIEIPKDNDQRWHLNFARTAIENFGPIKEVIPVNEGKMPVAYGYLEDIFNHDESSEGGEKENLDVLILSRKAFEIGEKAMVKPIGIITRKDGDHKIVSVDNTVDFNSWEDINESERSLIAEYFGYKSPILSIEGSEIAEKYILKSAK